MAKRARQRKFTVSVEGAKELLQSLDRMGDQAASFITASVNAGGNVALRAAKANTARFKHPTGFLERSLQKFPVIRRKSKAASENRVTKAVVRVGFKLTKGMKSRHLIKKYGLSNPESPYYASFVELGSKYQQAKRFLRDAIDKNRKQTADAIVKSFRRLKG
jgi:HK97 gp10 family phage protein